MTSTPSHTIGVDFDNTIVSYDDLFFREALSMGLVEPSSPRKKIEVRDYIRTRFDDVAWQKVQGRVYGSGMARSKPAAGVKDFFQLCETKKAKVYVVSHKTEFAAFDETRTNLHQVSRDWLSHHRFLTRPHTGLQECDVFFEPTLQKKVERISELGCSHFIDDLQEVLLNDHLDRKLTRILYSPGRKIRLKGVEVLGNWKEIADNVFPQ